MEPIVHFEQDILSFLLVFGLSKQTEQTYVVLSERNDWQNAYVY
jgi:hypothetical protein